MTPDDETSLREFIDNHARQTEAKIDHIIETLDEFLTGVDRSNVNLVSHSTRLARIEKRLDRIEKRIGA